MLSGNLNNKTKQRKGTKTQFSWIVTAFFNKEKDKKDCPNIY